MDLSDIRKRLDERFVGLDDKLRAVASNLDNMEFVHRHRIKDGNLEVTYEPIILVSHDGTEQVNLGRLIAKITPNRTFAVNRDTTSERDAHLSSDRTHPHVRSGSVCVGNGVELEETLKDNGDIDLFIVLLHNFLVQYSNGNPYWRPFIFDPCRVCPRDFNCVFCKCNSCDRRREDDYDCSRCSDAGCLSSNSITQAIFNKIYAIRDNGAVDNDKLIKLYETVDEFEV